MAWMELTIPSKRACNPWWWDSLTLFTRPRKLRSMISSRQLSLTVWVLAQLPPQKLRCDLSSTHCPGFSCAPAAREERPAAQISRDRVDHYIRVLSEEIQAIPLKQFPTTTDTARDLLTKLRGIR